MIIILVWAVGASHSDVIAGCTIAENMAKVVAYRPRKDKAQARDYIGKPVAAWVDKVQTDRDNLTGQWQWTLG